MIDVAAVPDRLEDAVAEPEREDVLDGLLPEIVIDAIDLRLAQHLQDLVVERTGGFEIVPERLLDDDAAEVSVALAVSPASPSCLTVGPNSCGAVAR